MVNQNPEIKHNMTKYNHAQITSVSSFCLPKTLISLTTTKAIQLNEMKSSSQHQLKDAILRSSEVKTSH